MRAVIVVLILSCFASVNTAAQTVPATLSLGTVSGLNLNLIAPVTTAAGKTYYYVDADGDGMSNDSRTSHITLDNLLNGGSDTVDTQSGGHDGSDDQRSVIVGSHALVLPTRNELRAFREDQSMVSPWGNDFVWTATRQGGNMHGRYVIASGATFFVRDSDRNTAAVAFQVLPALITVPDAPADVSLTAGDSQISVAWTFVPVADNGGGTITRYTATASTSGEDDKTCTAPGFNATSCTITGLTNNVEYRVVVVATNSAGDSEDSTPQTATPSLPLAPAAAPDDVILTSGDSQISVVWTPVPDAANGGAAISTYTATASTSGENDKICTAIGSSANTCTITGLSNGIEYRVVVVATNSEGDSEDSDVRTAIPSTVPDTPEGVILTVGDSQVTVTWTAVLEADNGGAAITGYTATATAPSRPPETCTTDAAATTCTITGLTNGVVYSVVVVATNIQGNSVDSMVQTVTPRPSLTPPPIQTLTPLSLGTVSGINLHLITPVTTVAGKTYYYVDADEDGMFNDNGITHSILDNLLNGGNDTVDTQSGGHDGSADARSVIVGSHALVLPTQTELRAFREDQSMVSPWGSLDLFWTATQQGRDTHARYGIVSGATFFVRDSDRNTAAVAFQVLPALITVPDAPADVSLTAGDSQISVAWTFVPVADNGGGTITAYTATATATVSGETGFCTAPGFNATNCTIIGLTNNVEYSVVVVATNSAGDSADSDVRTATPSLPLAPAAAPDDVILTSGDSQISVAWTPVPDAANGGAAISTYTATASTSGENDKICTAIGSSANTCTITGLSNGVEYRVVVVATNSEGDSEDSDVRTAIPSTVPDTPEGVILTVGDSQVTVTWTAVLEADNGGAAITGYTATATAASRLPQICTTDDAAATTCTITGLTNGVVYSVVVVATNIQGNSVPSMVQTVTPSPLITVPDAPTGVSLTVDDSQTVVTWRSVPDADNGGATITGYTATASTTSEDDKTCTAPGFNATSCTITGLTNGLQYSVVVFATNNQGDGAASTPQTVTPASRPAAPGGVMLTVGDGQTTVTWTTVPFTDDGGAAITGYTATASTPGEDDKTCTATGSAATTCTIRGLTNGVEYSVVVFATNSQGDGADSTPQTVTPASRPAAPLGVILTGGGGQIRVTWTSVPDADNGGAAITGYTATASTTGEDDKTCTADGSAATTCTITGLTSGVEYSVVVFATNSQGNSDDSTPQTATLSAAIILRIKAFLEGAQ